MFVVLRVIGVCMNFFFSLSEDYYLVTLVVLTV